MQLCRAVASYAAVMVALVRIIESVYADVEHPVVKIGVLQNHPVHRPFGKLTAEIPLSDEMAAVEVSLADSPKVKQHHEADGSGSNGSC